MENTLSRTIARFVFYVVALILIGWTATLTYSFVSAALPTMPWYVPALSLVVFDAGMLAWLVVYLHFAEGAGQRAVAITLTVIDLIGVSLMVVAEILLGGQTWAVAPESLGEIAVWGIGLWTVVNVTGVISFHLLSPGARIAMALQGEKDAVFDVALKQLQEKRRRHANVLADSMSDSMMRDLVHNLFSDENAAEVPDIFRHVRQVTTGTVVEEEPEWTGSAREGAPVRVTADDRPTTPSPNGREL